MDRSFDISYWRASAPQQYSKKLGGRSSMLMRDVPADPMNSDFEELLSLFSDHEVKYLIVGEHA
jgi:hypothetical protein